MEIRKRPHLDLGLLIIRLGLGATYVVFHGFPKIMAGPERWEQIGRSMNYLGITFAPSLWGLAAGVGEVLGGLLLIFGLFTRFGALILAFVMAVATISQSVNGGTYTYPMEMGIVMVSLIMTGAGRLSLDHLRRNRRRAARSEAVTGEPVEPAADPM